MARIDAGMAQGDFGEAIPEIRCRGGDSVRAGTLEWVVLYCEDGRVEMDNNIVYALAYRRRNAAFGLCRVGAD